MENKNVLIISGVFYPEPIVSAGIITDLAIELSKIYHVTVLRPKPSRPMGFEIPEYNYDHFSFKVIEIESYICPASSLLGRFRESYSMGKWSVRYIQENYKELSFIYNAPWHIFGRHMVAKTALKYGIPYITPVQDIYPESLSSKIPNFSLLRRIVNNFFLPYDKFLLNHASRIHTISEKMVDYLSNTRNIPNNKFVVIRNWQNERDFENYTKKKISDFQNENFTFMYLGNIGPLAGIDVLFDALKEAHLVNARLVVAGSGSAKQGLMEKAKEYSECKIEFWDVPRDKVPETQDKADVMVLPVKKGYALSSIPSKLPAYMFSKKPVLASVDYDSDTAICIRDSNSGWVALPEDICSISEAMKKAFSAASEERAKMGVNGFNYAIENFSKFNNLTKLVNACVEVIE